MVAAKAVAAALLAALFVLAGPAAALTIRGDHDWVSSAECPEEWWSTAYDDSAWGPAEYPWLLIWPSTWEADPQSRPFWDPTSTASACVRRVFHLPTAPKGPALAHVFVDDDYEFYLNDEFIGESKDSAAQAPGESYDVTALLRPGRNVIGLKVINAAYEQGAYFSLQIPDLPEQPPSALARLRAVGPWAQFGGILGALALGSLLLSRGMARVRPGLARWPAGWVAILTLALAVAFQAAMSLLDLYTAPFEQPVATWRWPAVALVAGLFLALVCLRVADEQTDESGPLRGEWLWLAGILALAVFLRTWRVDSIPVGFFQDEATNALDAQRLVTPGEGFQLWSDSVGGRPTLFLYGLGLVLEVFGVSYLNLKILPIAVSTLAVGATYAVARAGLGPRPALWAAFFLAVSRWDIHYARMAWEVNCVPLFSAAGFALLLAGLRRESGGARRMVAGAVVLGLGLYTYAAYRAVPAAAALFLAAVAVSSERDVLWRQRWEVGRTAVAGALVALPLLVFGLLEPERYWERYRDVALTHYISFYGTPLPWLHQIGKGLLSLHHLGDELVRHNLPKAPHLDAVTGIFMLLGMATAARARQRLGLILAWVWFLTFLALASLTRDAPHATRYLGLVVPCVLFAGLGAARLFARARRALRLAPLVWMLAAGAAAGTVALNAYQYFVLEAHHPNADSEMNLTARVVCERVRLETGIHVYWTPDVAYWTGGPCHFLARDHFKAHELTAEDLASGNLEEKIESPALVYVGPEYLEPHRNLVSLDSDGLPLLGMPGLPYIQRDRQQRLMFYLWDLTD